MSTIDAGGVVTADSFPMSSGELETDVVPGDFAGDFPQPDARRCFTGVTDGGGCDHIVPSAALG